MMPKTRVDIQIGTTKETAVKIPTRARRGTLKYWKFSVDRLSIMTDRKLKSSLGVVNLEYLGVILDLFLAPYEGETNQPLLDLQVNEMRRVIDGGILI